MNAMQRAKAAMDAAAMQIIVTAHKDKARSWLNERPVVMTNRGYRIVDRWFRRVAYRAPRDLGKFIHGSVYEDPRNMQFVIPGALWRKWNGIPEAKYNPLFKPGDIS